MFTSICTNTPLLIDQYQRSSLVAHLGGHVDMGSLLQEQGGHVAVALLGGQVQRSHALLGQDVGLGSELQQRGGDLHLVLLGGNVEGGVAILKAGGPRG